jgi:hypothetical protein
MEEVVYSAESQLRSPARFVADTRADLRVSPGLAWRLFLHSLRANYRRSWLGYYWLLAPPPATTATWVFLNASRVLNVGPTETPYAVYVLSGTILWQVFADAINSPLQQLSNARAILTRSHVPHEALPDYVRGFGVGIVPYLFNTYTATVVPTKINEYLAMGKPVLSTDLPRSATSTAGTASSPRPTARRSSSPPSSARCSPPAKSPSSRAGARSQPSTTGGRVTNA